MTATLLEINDLSIRFGGLWAVSNFNLCMEKGELVGLIGPNGSGKSTVFNMISGFYVPTNGNINFEGSDITGKKPDEVAAKGIARVFQNNRLFNEMTVLENVLIGHHLRRRSSPIAAIVRSPGYRVEEEHSFKASIDLLNDLGLLEVANENAKSLPHGLQRKLEVARALATSPKLLLLDEPATGLSVEETTDMMEFVLRVQKDFNIAILLIEHTMRVVMGICLRILVLDHGETIAHGKPEQIREDKRVIEAYLGVD